MSTPLERAVESTKEIIRLMDCKAGTLTDDPMLRIRICAALIDAYGDGKNDGFNSAMLACGHGELVVGHDLKDGDAT